MSVVLDQLYASPLSTSIRDAGFIIPAVQSVHILSIGLLFGGALICDLKVLGVWGVPEPLALVYRRFQPWMMAALGALLLSGLVNAIGEPVRVFGNRIFWLKMALLLVACGLTALLGRAMRQNQAPISQISRVMALLSILLWVAIIICGRWIAYVAP
ncbi:DUF6644 family protein [Novosphingobium rosa]|uniref:DUF6644 family protein n=1 Tax=Novosphingobium rosa TaxID=76978 RepID=UPI000B325608|nr:DUF6644 family protein [Novosphingobium rosa]